MNNQQIARILHETAALLELDGAIIGRYRSYEKAADLIAGLPESVEQLCKTPEKLKELPAGQLVMLKLTLPEQDDFYADCIRHPHVLRVVALSGGYTREAANDRLRRNHGMIASFSRALVEGLTAQQSDAEFNALLDRSIQSIFEASNT